MYINEKVFSRFYIYISNHKNNVEVQRERERERERERDCRFIFMPTNSLCPSFISCKLT